MLLETSFQQLYEGCPLAHEVISFVGRHGFQIYDIATYAQRSYDGVLLQSDIFFAKTDSKLFADTDWG